MKKQISTILLASLLINTTPVSADPGKKIAKVFVFAAVCVAGYFGYPYITAYLYPSQPEDHSQNNPPQQQQQQQEETPEEILRRQQQQQQQQHKTQETPSNFTNIKNQNNNDSSWERIKTAIRQSIQKEKITRDTYTDSGFDYNS